MKGIGSHIVLIGFMGSGKTTVGKLLAASLDIGFIDMDAYIEEKEKSTIHDIFAEKGEAYFRSAETRALSEILALPTKVVISTGGGTPCFGDNMEEIKTKSVSIYLKVGRQRLVERLKGDVHRPLLQNKSEVELMRFVKMKLKEREHYYSSADIRLRAIDAPKRLTERLINYIQSIHT